MYVIIKVYEQTSKTISEVALFNTRKSVKRDSYQGYKKLREGQYEYVHEFKEWIDKIYGWKQDSSTFIIWSTSGY